MVVKDEMLNVSMRDSLMDGFQTERRVIRKQRVIYKELTHCIFRYKT